VVCNPLSGSTFPIGVTVVNCTAFDSCGNHTNCSFRVHVVKKRFFPGPNLPPTDGQYVSPAQWHAAYANGIYITNVVHRRFTTGYPPPPTGTTTNHTFDSVVDMSLSLDNGQTFQRVSANALCTISITALGGSGSDQVFQTEMMQLDLSGGTMPVSLRLRESPTLQSTGETRITPSSGGFMVSSFFDVFTEVSMDGGQTWSASSSPGTMDLHIDPGVPPTAIVQPVIVANKLQFTVQSRVGLRYILEFKSNLTDQTWTALTTTPGNGLVLTITDNIVTSGAPHRFYHLRIEEDPNQ
jgi:hypothetical protein